MSLTIETAEAATSPKPRTIILDLFGDYLRERGGSVRAGHLMILLGAFGIEPAAVRMTLSRLKREGWFTTRRVGRETIYTLTDHLIGILDEGRSRIFADYGEPWDGTWTTVVHRSGLDRVVRDQVRKQLSWLGFGPLASSTWISPRDRSEQARGLDAEVGEPVVVTIMRSVTGRPEEDRALAESCWDLPAINAAYADFLTAHADLPGVAGGLAGADALVARVTLIAGYRHFPFLDPWLPTALQPEGWLGEQANALFHTLHDTLAPQARAYVESVVDRSSI